MKPMRVYRGDLDGAAVWFVAFYSRRFHLWQRWPQVTFADAMRVVNLMMSVPKSWAR